jgi:hypothetical protein
MMAIRMALHVAIAIYQADLTLEVIFSVADMDVVYRVRCNRQGLEEEEV